MKPIILISALLLSSSSLLAQQQMRGGNRGGNTNFFQTNGLNNRNTNKVQTINDVADNVQSFSFNNVSNLNNIGPNGNRGNSNLSNDNRGGNNYISSRGNRGNNPMQVNTDRNEAIQTVSRNSYVQSVQIIEVQSRGNRGNSSNDKQINLALNTNEQQKTSQVKSEKTKQGSSLGKIELPSPKNIETSKEDKISIPKVPINLSGLGKSEKTKKASQGWGRNPNNKHFMKKKVWKPMKRWFKRHFKRTKKQKKAKLTCFFKS